MTYGIAYHSPLDIVSLVPDNVKIVLGPVAEKGTVLFTKKYLTEVDCPQIVFSSQRYLTKNGIPILDQGSNGKILNLKQIQWNSFLKGKDDG